MLLLKISLSPLKMMLAYISRMRHTVFLVSSLILLMLVYRKTIGGADLTMHALRLRGVLLQSNITKRFALFSL